MISGKTILIAHIGFPTEAFKAPLIYNPWFEKQKIDAAVIPMGIKIDNFQNEFKAVFQLTNVHGALITMPHKITTTGLLEEVSTAVQIAGACNAVLKRADGSLLGDMFDGVGFTRVLQKKGFRIAGAKCLVVGCGGVGSAIAASLAAEGASELALFDIDVNTARHLAARLQKHYPRLNTHLHSNDPNGFDLLVNGTPLGMKVEDPLPVDVTRLSPTIFVGEVVMKVALTPLLVAARARGCPHQMGTDMLYEMIPAYLEFFGLGHATSDELRAVSKITD